MSTRQLCLVFMMLPCPLCMCLFPGDKVETAISIAFSCHLFTPDMGILEFRESDYVHGKTVVDVQNVS